MIFASNPAHRAKAKLELNARVKEAALQRILHDPEQALAIAMSEARLTPIEILTVVFPYEEGGHRCVACGKHVAISTVTYHSVCQVTQWLQKYTAYKYDSSEGCLAERYRWYMTAELRRKLSTILRLHAALKQDIVVKRASEVTIWKRQEDGSLKKVNALTKRPEDIVGTAEWMRKNGFSSPKR